MHKDTRDTEIRNEGKEGRLSADTLTSFVSVPLVGHAKWQVAGHIGMSARNVGGATNRDSLSTCHPDGAAMLVEVDATAVTELLLVRLIAKIREVIASLLVRNEVQQTQELVVNASRGRHADRQKRHSAIVAIWIPILTNLVSSSLLEDLVGPVRVAEHAMALPAITTSANEVVTDSGIGKQDGTLQHADAKDRNVSTAFHFAGHHLLDVRDMTRFLADATEGIQHVIMSTIPVRAVSVAAMNMIAIVEVALTAAPFLSYGSQDGSVSVPKVLTKECNVVRHIDDDPRGPRVVRARVLIRPTFVPQYQEW